MTTIKELIKYQNGNATVTLHTDGTRFIEWEGDQMVPETPFGIDIRVSTRCSFGMNPILKKAICEFCHESARVDGQECRYRELNDVMKDLPAGTELAIGCNDMTHNLINFIGYQSYKSRIVNLTVNHGHVKSFYGELQMLTANECVRGLGISYRPEYSMNLPEFIMQYPHTVWHVIAGIDDINQVEKLASHGVKKILVLGEKDFGFNQGRVDLRSDKHRQWFRRVRFLFDMFEVVSFDTLAIEQLRLKRFFTAEQWPQFYHAEYSMYIDAVNQTYSINSRASDSVSWDEITLREFFKQHVIESLQQEA